MPEFYRVVCENCNFTVPCGYGYLAYAVDGEGNRKICPHPGEHSLASMITGLSLDEMIAQKRIGALSPHLCCECLIKFDIDSEIDERRCPECQSTSIRDIGQLLEDKCPKCHEGKIEKEYTGLVT